jgi:hypothetical protein
MTLAKRLLNHTEGFNVLSTRAEIEELAYVGVQPLRLQYLKGSKQKMGQPYWNLLSPQLPGYKLYGGMNGYPTFGLDTLKSKGLL